MTHMKNILEKLYIFEWFDSNLLDEILNKSTIKDFKTWDVIIKEWDEASSAYVIIEWYVNVSKNGQDISTIFEWDIFWEIALVTNEKRTATITADDDLKVIELNKETLLEIIKLVPNWDVIKNTILNRIMQNHSSK